MTIERAPGRPRDPAVLEAIALACRELIPEVGYSRLTMDAVAERAGVGRPTIYRRWPSKAHMVWDVLFTTPNDAIMIGDTEDLRADITLWVIATLDFFARPEIARAFPGLLAEQTVEDSWHARLRDPVLQTVQGRLRRAVTAGELRSDVDVAAVFDLVTGFAIYRATVPQPPGTGCSPHIIVEQILRGAGS